MSPAITTASAGSLTSGDCLVLIEPHSKGSPALVVQSTVEKRFGAAIRATCERVLKEHGAPDVSCLVQDRGAFEFVIEARLATALLRAKGGEAR